MALAFISYRRQDSSAAARWLRKTLLQTFGRSSVFMDVESIRASSKWKDDIESALRAASVLIVVIGPSWLKIADQYGQRRLDQPADWVRQEIAYALANDLKVLPLLLAKTALPPSDALPSELAELTSHQAFEPLEGWEPVTSEIPGRSPLERTELRKIFEFESFGAAISFMSEAAEHIAAVQHHPRWENVWRTVTVWLSTWDIGAKPSQLDLELARYLDELFRSKDHRAGDAT